MKLQRYGRIVVIASSLARTSAQNASAYVASKWGTVGLTKAAALDLAPFGITVNAVAPGSVLTKMVDNEHLARLFRPELDDPTIEDAMPLLAQLNPMRVALLDPEEIARVVLFLADAASSHISGAVIDVNAGSSALYSS